MIDSSLPPPGAVLDAGLINEFVHHHSPRRCTRCETCRCARLCWVDAELRVCSRSSAREDTPSAVLSSAQPHALYPQPLHPRAALRAHRSHTARLCPSPGAGAAGARPVAASRLRDSQAVGAPAARRRDGSELRLTSAQSSVWSIGSLAARNRDAIRQVAAASDPPLPHRPRSEMSRDEPR